MKLAALVAVAVVGVASAANTYQVFPLNKPLLEQVVVCLQKDVPVEAMKAVADNNRSKAEGLMNKGMADGVCGFVQTYVTYTKRIFLREVAGVPLAVYEAKIGEVVVYVPMVGFRHDHPV